MVRTIDHTFSLDHTANAYPVLCSIEWVSVFLPSLDKTLIHRKLTLPLPLPLPYPYPSSPAFCQIFANSLWVSIPTPEHYNTKDPPEFDLGPLDPALMLTTTKTPCFLNRESALRFTNLVRNLKHSWRCRICLNHFSMPSSTPNQISSAAFAVKLWWKHCSIFPPLCVDLFLALQNADNALLLYGHWKQNRISPVSEARYLHRAHPHT